MGYILFSCKYLYASAREAVNQQMRLKYQHAFFAHFANYVNQLIYQNIYTEYRVTTKDLLHRVSDAEHLITYFHQELTDTQPIIAFHAQFFQSPLRITTEIPLMILTGTREVLMRRKKRLRKLVTNESSSSQGTSSISVSLLSHSTVEILNEPLSNLTFNLQSSSLSYYSSSAANVYETPSGTLKNEESTLSKIDPWERFIIREAVENELRHLIVEFHPKPQSSETIESIKSIQSKRDIPRSMDFSEKLKDISGRPSQSSNREIQSVVKAQLRKYNIGQVMERNSLPSSRLSKSKKRVREKAQQLLRHIRTSSIS